MTEKTRRWLSYYLFITMAVSSFVSYEPAPYDLLFISLVTIGFLFSFYKFSKETIFPLLIVCVFLLSNLQSLFFLTEIGPSSSFVGTTFYLAFTWVGLVGMGPYLKHSSIHLIHKGYLLSACFSTAIGILAYFQLLPNSDQLLMFDRVKGFFKDPNVFGPYLVIPALFALSMTEAKKTSIKKKCMYYLSFLTLVIGILLSFSRAAWGNFAISLVIYLFIVKKEEIGKRVKMLFLLVIVGLPAFLYFIQTPMVGDLLESRLSYQSYDDSRFDTQKEAYLTGLSNPFGVGSGQADVVFQRSPHSLYARVFTENGVTGILSITLLFIVSLFKSYQSYRNSESEVGSLYLIIFSSLVGLVFNSFFVDTLHWRHLWVVLALGWIPFLNEKEQRNVNN